MTDIKTINERVDTATEHARQSIENIIPEVIEAVTHGDYDEAIDLLMDLKKCEVLMEAVEEVRDILNE